MAPVQDARWSEGVHRSVLPNGLTLLVQREPSAPVAAIVTHVKAGFFDEPDRWTGISHVLEHMFFKGTPTRGPGQIARATKAVGGYLNASTSYDHTSYFAVLPAERLPEAARIQADALMHAAIDPDELGRELQVIIQEARRKLDHPGAVTYETLHEVMFDRHRIRRWRIGHESQLAGFSRDDVAGYYRSRYLPGRVIVAVAGDVDPGATLAMLTELYTPWAAAPATADPSPSEPPRREVRVRTLRGDVTLAELALGWRGVPPLDPQAVALDLAAAVLAAGRGSWLYRCLREPGLATTVSAHHYAPTELGVFSVGAECEPGRIPEVVQQLGEAVFRLTSSGPGEDDLERARTLLLGRWSRRMEEADARASALAHAEALGDYHLLQAEYEALVRTSAEEVRRAAASVLDPGAVSAVGYLPKQGGSDLTPDAVTVAFRPSAGAGRLAPPRSADPDPPRTAPTGRRHPTSGTAGILHWDLPAFDVLCYRKTGVPVATVGVYLPRARFDPAGRAGLSALTVRGALRGAGRYDAAALAFAFERLGGTLGSSVTLDWIGFGTTVLAERLSTAVRLLATVLDEPRFEPVQVLAERRLLVEETTQIADDMFRFPFQLALGQGFGDQGYGIPALGLPAELEVIQPEEVVAWHRGALQGARGVLIVVGDLEPEMAARELELVFGGVSARAPRPLSGRCPWTLGGVTPARVVQREKAQSAVAMAFPGPTRGDPERHVAEVWAAIASGLGGRLFEALRERRSLAYTVVVSAWQKARAGAFLSYIATAPEREQEAREAMLAELARFSETEVERSELNQSTAYLTGQLAVNRQSTAAIAGEILEAWLAGSGLEEFGDLGQRYRTVTAADVRRLAGTILAGARAEGVVRGRDGGR